MKEATAYVEELYKENSETYQTAEAYPIKQDKRPLFKEWYFVEEDMEHDEFITEDTKKFKGSFEVPKGQKALEAAASTFLGLTGDPGNPSSSSTMKLENPEWPVIEQKKTELAHGP